MHWLRRQVLIASIAAALAVTGLPGSAAAGQAYDWIDWRTDLAPLDGSTYWVLQGQRTDAGCTYEYPSEPADVPASGWEIRSVALDPDRCAKLVEEGAPTQYEPISTDDQTTSLDLDAVATSALSAKRPHRAIAAASGSQSAWQQVVWRDIVGLWLTYDVSQVDWSYNGSTVTSGSTHGHWGYRWGSGWAIDSYGNFPTWGSGSSYLRSESWSNFHNGVFCAPLPVVYTWYYYDRIWGFPDGHATRSQSSDSVNECLPFHFDIYSAYGNWPGTVP